MNLVVDRLSAPEPSAHRDGAPPLLEIRGLRKTFGGTVAVADGNLSVQAGEVHGLLGENGAGKSTMIRCLARIFPPDGGEILVGGEPLPDNLQTGSSAGLAFIHQETNLVEELSVAENIALSIGYSRRFGLIDWKQVEQIAHEALATMQIDLDPRKLVAELPQATRTAVAIARAVAEKARILVLDEPTANLSATEVHALFRILRRLRDSGVGIVFVSHRLDEVYELCDRVTVLRDGATVGTVLPSQTTQSELVQLITGHEVQMPEHIQSAPDAPPVLIAEEVKAEFVGPLSFIVRQGEIVGFTGLTDAGHYQLGAALFGLVSVESGSLELNDTPYRPHGPDDAMARGVGFVPPDRGSQGIAPEMSVAENLFLNPAPDHDIYGLRHFIMRRRERAAAQSLLSRFDVRPQVPDVQISALSGGNAQKVLVARWMQRTPPLIILNDLTAGVDIGARQEIYQIVSRAAQAGTTVIVITSDFEEITVLCTRAYILARGRIVAELPTQSLNVKSITEQALVGGGQRA